MHDVIEQDKQGQGGAAADIRQKFEEQAQAKRSRVLGEQQKNPGLFAMPGGEGISSPGGIGMEEPGYKATGPNAFEAEQELAQMRGAAHAKGKLNQQDSLPDYWLNYADARAAGYTREQIDEHTKNVIDGALRAGYSYPEIDHYMNGVSSRKYTGSEKPNPAAGIAADLFRGWQDAWFGPHSSASAQGSTDAWRDDRRCHVEATRLERV